MVVQNLRKATGRVTPKQLKLARAVGLKIPRNLPKLVAAARLRIAYGDELCTPPTLPPTDTKLEFLSSLDKRCAQDSRVVSDRIEADAWIIFYLLKRRMASLEKLQLQAGDVVQFEDSEGTRIEEIASINSDGRIYFRGGHNAREWPDKVTVKCRARDNSKAARLLRKSTANQAAARIASRDFSVAKERELKEFKITRAATVEEIELLRNVIDNARDEKPIQAFLENHSCLLATLVGGRSRFVVPRPNLGGKRIPDFLIADVDSAGINWTLVELETPVSTVTLRENLLDKYARKGLSQIVEWRNWIEENLELARRSRRDGGLSLVDISPRSGGLVLVGRRERLGKNAREVRRPIRADQHVEVHTYDYLLERLEGALRFNGPSGVNPYLIHPWRNHEEELQTEMKDLFDQVETDRS
jgi:hypothetical protein